VTDPQVVHRIPLRIHSPIRPLAFRCILIRILRRRNRDKHREHAQQRRAPAAGADLAIPALHVGMDRGIGDADCRADRRFIQAVQESLGHLDLSRAQARRGADRAPGAVGQGTARRTESGADGGTWQSVCVIRDIVSVFGAAHGAALCAPE
jgi:hypothetical protein